MSEAAVTAMAIIRSGTLRLPSNGRGTAAV
jgi:hypothetical protein